MAILQYPIATEKGIRHIEAENTILFVVDNKAKKADIKQAAEKMLGGKVVNINTFNGPDGTKRAYIKFHSQTPAIDIATKLGIM